MFLLLGCRCIQKEKSNLSQIISRILELLLSAFTLFQKASSKKQNGLLEQPLFKQISSKNRQTLLCKCNFELLAGHILVDI